MLFGFALSLAYAKDIADEVEVKGFQFVLAVSSLEAAFIQFDSIGLAC